ncbi:MAG: hypothetical protein FJW53_07825 [Actinobacteria bacterium]|nr:hypothetical protein [Actinomycetota bacterium]
MDVIVLLSACVIGGLLLLIPRDIMGRLAAEVRHRRPSPRRTRDARQLIEAIATWTEMLRDTLGAASGLEQALIATAERAPTLLEEPLMKMVATMRYGSLEDALREFADEVDHAVCDFVVAALVTASNSSPRDVGALLGRLSESTRDESAVHLRVWVSRARSRTSVRIISGSVATFVVGLVVLAPAYLAPYASRDGVLVLLAVAGLFTSAYCALVRMARAERSPRFVALRVAR